MKQTLSLGFDPRFDAVELVCFFFGLRESIAFDVVEFDDDRVMNQSVEPMKQVRSLLEVSLLEMVDEELLKH